MKSQTSLRKKEWKYLKLMAYFLSAVLFYFTASSVWEFIYPKLLPNYKVNGIPLPSLYESAKRDSVSGEEEVKKEAKEFLKQVEKEYPLPSLVNLLHGKYEGAKWKFVLGGIFLFFLANFPFLLFYYYDKKVMRPFFFWTAKREPPLELGTAVRLLDYDYLKLKREKVFNWFFKDKKAEEEFWKVLNKRIPKGVKFIFEDGEERDRVWESKKEGDVIYDAIEINKFIRRHIDNLTEFARQGGYLKDKEEEEEFRVAFTFVLYHRILESFGGIPVGFLSPRIKSKVAKRVLSTYYLRKLPYTSLGSEDYKARKWLKAFYDYNSGREDLFSLCLSFSQVPDIEFFLV